MNPMIERYLPPCLVFGAALYFGWPPPEPLDLGPDVVRAESVRWRKQDLAQVLMPVVNSDPFAAVLVAKQAMEIEPETGKAVVPPVGPSATELRASLRLDGIANMGGRLWAILNGRPRLPGQVVRTDDIHRHECEIVSIDKDRIVIRCKETETEIFVRANGSDKPSTRSAEMPAADPSAVSQQPTSDSSTLPPVPPQA